MAKAIEADDAAAVKEAIAAGAEVNPPGPLRRTPLSLALDSRAGAAVAIALLEAGADAEEADFSRNPRQSSPLTRACRADSTLVVKALLAAGASPEGLPGQLTRPLHEAAWASEDLVELLLAAGAAPDPRDHADQTPYMINALFRPSERVLAALLAAGADPAALDCDGRTALALAREMGGQSPERERAMAFLERVEERALLERAAGPGMQGGAAGPRL